jgi:hypothetical protein
MGWRFRKGFSSLPGVRLTFSPRGVGTSIGAGTFELTTAGLSAFRELPAEDAGRNAVGATMRNSRRGLAIASVCLILAASEAGAEARVSDLYIVAGGDTVLAGRDIGSYEAATGKLALTTEGVNRWSRWECSQIVDGMQIPKLSILTGRPFRLEVSGARIADGHFTSVLSSTLYEGLLLYDPLIRSGDSHLRFVCGDVPDSSRTVDPLKSEALLGYFRTAGKLVERER